MLDQIAMLALSLHPGIVKMAHKAAAFDKQMKSAVGESQQQAPTPRPVAKVGGNAQAARDPDKMSTDEWLKWRNAQLRQK